MEVNPHPPSDSLMDDSEISLTVELEYQQALRPCGDMSKLYCPHGGRCKSRSLKVGENSWNILTFLPKGAQNDVRSLKQIGCE